MKPLLKPVSWTFAASIRCRFVLNRDPNTRAFFTEMSGPARLPLFMERFERKSEMLFMKPDRGVKAFEVSSMSFDALTRLLALFTFEGNCVIDNL